MAAQLPIDVQLLGPRRDSMEISVKGQVLGWLSTQVTRTDDGFHQTDILSLGEFAHQRTEIDLDQRGIVRRVQFGGMTTGISIRASLEYRRNRVRGVTVASTGGRFTDSTATPDATADSAESRSVSIKADTALPAGTIDDNAILFYLPALAWSDGARFTVPVYFGQQNLIRTVSLVVQGQATVSLRSGPVEAWEVELTGGLSPARYYISQAAPHRLVRMEFPSAGIVFLRIE